MTTAVPAAARTTARPDETAPRTPDGPDAEGRPRRRHRIPGHVRRLHPAAEAVRRRHRRPHRLHQRPSDNSALLWGSWLEVVTAAACIGTAVALYPVTRRVSRTAAIGFVTSRVVEATLILVGVMSLLSLVTLQGHFAGATGAQADALGVTGESLVAMRQWTFLLGPGLIAGINALFLGTAMYRGRLVPRVIPTIGLIGAPIILMSATATIFGGWAQTSTVGALCALPIAVWEFSLGVWLTVKGFTPAPAVASA